MAALLQEIENRWHSQFRMLADGGDLAPTQRLRLEGMMEAAVLAGEVEAEELVRRMALVYAEIFGRTLADDFGEQWSQLFPFPQVPAMAARAPVVPTTRD
jgi:hypothetical protein